MSFMSLQKRMNTLLQEYTARELVDLWGVKKKLADRVRVKPPSVDAWFNGKTQTINSAHLFGVARFFGVYAEWIATGSGPKYAENTKEVELPPRSSTSLSLRTRRMMQKINKLMPEELDEIEAAITRYTDRNEAIYHHLHRQMGGALLAQTGDFAGERENPETDNTLVYETNDFAGAPEGKPPTQVDS